MKVDDPTDYEYVLVQWPESQVFMDYEWFDSETSLADFDKFGNSAYFIPMKRYLAHIKENYESSAQLPQDTYEGDILAFEQSLFGE